MNTFLLQSVRHPTSNIDIEYIRNFSTWGLGESHVQFMQDKQGEENDVLESQVPFALLSAPLY